MQIEEKTKKENTKKKNLEMEDIGDLKEELKKAVGREPYSMKELRSKRGLRLGSDEPILVKLRFREGFIQRMNRLAIWNNTPLDGVIEYLCEWALSEKIDQMVDDSDRDKKGWLLERLDIREGVRQILNKRERRIKEYTSADEYNGEEKYCSLCQEDRKKDFDYCPECGQLLQIKKEG